MKESSEWSSYMNKNSHRGPVLMVMRLPKDNICLIKELSNLSYVIKAYKGITVRVEVGSRFKWLESRKGGYCWFYNIGVFTPFEIALRQLFWKQKCILSLHEPKMRNKRGYGVKIALRILAVELLASISMAQANALVVFSKHASDIVKGMGWLGRKKRVLMQPLLQTLGVDPAVYRRSDNRVLIIGRFHLAKRLSLIKRVIEFAGNEAPDILFRIYTSDVDKLSKAWLEKRANVELINKESISDEEIWDGFFESKVLLKLDTNMTQSGLIAQARSCCCKTITTDIRGFAQDYFGSYSGSLVSVKDDEKKIVAEIVSCMTSYSDDYADLERLAEEWTTGTVRKVQQNLDELLRLE